jgi:hypothetical protein
VISTGPALPEVTGSTAGSPSAEALGRLYRPDPLEVPVMIARDGPISTIDPSRTGTFAAATATPVAPEPNATDAAVAEALGLVAAPVPQVFETAPDQVMLVAVRESWIRVSSPDGTVLYEQVLNKGDTYAVPQLDTPAQLRSGNAGGLYVAMNGQLLGPVGTDGEVVKNIAMSTDTLSTQYAVADIEADTDLADVVKVAQNTAGQ